MSMWLEHSLPLSIESLQDIRDKNYKSFAATSGCALITAANKILDKNISSTCDSDLKSIGNVEEIRELLLKNLKQFKANVASICF